METASKARQPFLIADSSGLISLTSHADRNYSRALRAARELEETQATILVPYDVFAETINMVGKKQGHAKAYEVGRLLSKTAPFLVIDSSPAARDLALSRLLKLSRQLHGCGGHGSCRRIPDPKRSLGLMTHLQTAATRISPDGQRQTPRNTLCSFAICWLSASPSDDQDG
jgi:hypothetical protein